MITVLLFGVNQMGYILYEKSYRKKNIKKLCANLMKGGNVGGPFQNLPLGFSESVGKAGMGTLYALLLERCRHLMLDAERTSKRFEVDARIEQFDESIRVTFYFDYGFNIACLGKLLDCADSIKITKPDKRHDLALTIECWYEPRETTKRKYVRNQL